MGQIVTLVGAEQVQNAANTMRDAAAQMRESTTYMDARLREHAETIELSVERSERSVSALVCAMGMLSLNLSRLSNGLSIGYDEAAFCALFSDADPDNDYAGR